MDGSRWRRVVRVSAGVLRKIQLLLSFVALQPYTLEAKVSLYLEHRSALDVLVEVIALSLAKVITAMDRIPLHSQSHANSLQDQLFEIDLLQDPTFFVLTS